jgi:hypothetical protein
MTCPLFLSNRNLINTVREFVKNNLPTPFGKFKTFRKVFKKQVDKLFFTNSVI